MNSIFVYFLLFFVTFTESLPAYDSNGNDPDEPSNIKKIVNCMAEYTNGIKGFIKQFTEVNVKATKDLINSVKSYFPSSRTDIKTPAKSVGDAAKTFGSASVGLLTNALSQGIDGVNSLISGGREATLATINTVNLVSDMTYESAMRILDKGTDATIDGVKKLKKSVDNYKKLMSGMSKVKEDKGHSIKLTLSSGSVSDFVNEYLPFGTGTGTGNLPEVTNVDLTGYFTR